MNETIIKDLRRCGNSTRLADHYIQMLFETGECVVRDHFENGNHVQANRILFRKVDDRLYSEHRSAYDDLVFDKNNFVIKLK